MKHRQGITRIGVGVVTAAIITALVGCGAAESRSAAAPRSGTARMADTLKALYPQALANPLGNPFLSRQRADAIQSTITYSSGSRDLDKRFRVAQERLMAGQTREAIADLEKLLRDSELPPDRITPDAKPLFDLIALAYLRLGEQENCIGNPAANVCILPLEGGGRHVHEEGARGAIATYTELLRNFPDDRGSQWLLNIAWLAIGGYPDSIPPRYLIPNLAPRANDPFPRFPNVAGDVGAQVIGLAGGVSIDDFNGDGRLDIFTTSWGLNQPPHLLLADGTGRYADHTAESGLAGIVGGLNTVDADFDNDGDVDIVVNNIHDAPDLFRLDRSGPVHWLSLELVGTRSNRSAIGALVRVTTADGEQRQEVRGGGSYFSQNDLRLHFGLGDAATVQRVVVRWPNGDEETWTGLARDRLHTLREGGGGR
jgi:hypothetical protein